MKRVIIKKEESDKLLTIFSDAINSERIYVCHIENCLYKLHCVSHSTPIWGFVNLTNSYSTWDGYSDTFEQAINLVLDQGYNVYELKDEKELVKWLGRRIEK